LAAEPAPLASLRGNIWSFGDDEHRGAWVPSESGGKLALGDGASEQPGVLGAA